MRHVKFFVSTGVVLVLIIVLAGCATPPEAEKEAAKKAMDAAISAGADKYAAADLDAAKKIWDTAESQVKEKKYKEAKQSYIDAKAAFEKAAAAVEAGKKAVAEEVNATLITLEGTWKNLEAKATKMKKRLKDKSNAWATDEKAISEGLGKAKEMVATAPFEAKAKLDELKTMVEKWEQTFKEMTASLAKQKPKPASPKKKKK
jgi:hypothetical protein